MDDSKEIEDLKSQVRDHWEKLDDRFAVVAVGGSFLLITQIAQLYKFDGDLETSLKYCCLALPLLLLFLYGSNVFEPFMSSIVRRLHRSLFYVGAGLFVAALGRFVSHISNGTGWWFTIACAACVFLSTLYPFIISGNGVRG